MYSESIESTLRADITGLRTTLRNTELDLEDATRSRRDLQQQVQQLEVYREAVVQDNNFLKVASPTRSPTALAPAHPLCAHRITILMLSFS